MLVVVDETNQSFLTNLQVKVWQHNAAQYAANLAACGQTAPGSMLKADLTELTTLGTVAPGYTR